MLSDIYRHSCYHGLNSFREEKTPHARAAAAARPAQRGGGGGRGLELGFGLG